MGFSNVISVSLYMNGCEEKKSLYISRVIDEPISFFLNIVYTVSEFFSFFRITALKYRYNFLMFFLLSAF